MPRHLRSLALLLVLCSAASADEARLLTVVGDDAGLVVEVVDAEATARAVTNGEFARRLRETAMFRDWLAGRDYRNFVQAREAVERVLGQPVERFVGDLFGREFVLALFPVEGGEPEAVLVARAESERSLTEAISTWDRLQPPEESVVLRHADREYVRRRHRSGTMFYVADGDLFAVSQTESRIHAVLERLSAGETGSLLADERYQSARGDVPDEVAAVAYFNPRAWDAALPEPSDPEGRAVREALDRVESVLVALRTDDGLVLDAVARYDGERADERWQRYVERIAGNGRFLGRVPSRALYVGVGRIDVGTIAGLVYESLPERERRRAEPWRRFAARRFLDGLDPLVVLSQYGPEWGAYVVPRERMEPGVSPVEGLAAVELPAPDGSEAATARRALDDLLHTGLEFWVAVHNSEAGDEVAAVRDRVEADGTTVRWIEGVGPYRPGYALTPEFLVLASSPSIVPEFLEPADGDRLVDTPAFERLRERYFPGANQLVFLNFEAGRAFVERNREFLIAELARQRGADPGDVAPRALRVEEVLGLVDGVFVAGAVTRDHVRLAIGIVAE